MSNTPAQPPKDTLKKIETTFDNQGNIKYILARMNATGKKSQHRTYYTDLDVLEKVKE